MAKATLNNLNMVAPQQLLLEHGLTKASTFIFQSFLQSRDATRGWASWRPVVRGNTGFCYASAFCLARASLWAFKPLGTTAPCVPLRTALSTRFLWDLKSHFTRLVRSRFQPLKSPAPLVVAFAMHRSGVPLGDLKIWRFGIFVPMQLCQKRQV